MSTNKIKVMHLLPSLHPGGMENGVVNLANLLPKSFRTLVCCLETSGDFADRITNNNVKIIELHKKPGVKPGIFFQLARLMRKENVDIVHTHNHLTYVYGIPAAVIARVPVIIHGEHGTPEPYGYRRKLMSKIYEYFLTSVYAVSQTLGNEVSKQKGFNPEKIIVLPNGVNTDLFKPLPKDPALLTIYNFQQDDIVIGSVGRIEPVKNYELLVNTVLFLKAKGYKVKGLLVGDGSKLSTIRETICKNNLKDYFVLAGKSDNLPAMYSLMDIFVLTSKNEGMSNSLLEAMSCGKPVVVTDVGGNRELVQEGINGFVVSLSTENIFYKRVEQLVDDIENRQRMASKSRTIAVEGFSLQQMVKRYVLNYRRFSNIGLFIAGLNSVIQCFM